MHKFTALAEYLTCSYFKKSTNFTEPSERATKIWNFTWDGGAWGKEGPIQVTFPPFQWETFSSFRNAFTEVSDIIHGVPIPRPIDGNSGSAVGALWVPSSQDSARQARSSAVTGYYELVRYAPNFELMLKTKVTRVLFDENHKAAVGVEVLDRETGSLRQIRAKMEVILAAGAIYTPNILQKSGVGLRSMLEDANVCLEIEIHMSTATTMLTTTTTTTTKKKKQRRRLT